VKKEAKTGKTYSEQENWLETLTRGGAGSTLKEEGPSETSRWSRGPVKDRVKNSAKTASPDKEVEIRFGKRG